MSLNPLRWVGWLINEHGSSTVLRERLGQAHDQMAILQREIASLKSERDDFRSRLEKAQVEVENLKKEIQALHKKQGVFAVVG
jgi:FtsZ-binding cell division protein ZapB